VSEAERLRLFFAAEVPVGLRQAVGDAVASERRPSWGGRWTSVESQHVTLKFLGWTASDRLEEVRGSAETVAGGRRAADCRIGDLGAFPSLRRARVLWVGLEDPAGLTSGLAGDLDRAFERLGYAAEKRPFTPHLTLARFKSPVRLEGRLGERPWGSLPPFQVAGFNLYRSRLHPAGARYEVLASFALSEAVAGSPIAGRGFGQLG
jgi:2'-5' RNA ligase